jgi:hypothetical protein
MNLKATLTQPAMQQRLLLILAIVLLPVLFYLPLFQGKQIRQYDTQQIRASQQDIMDYNAKHPDEAAHWGMRSFSGMPSAAIYTKREGLNVLSVFSRYASQFGGHEVSYTILGMLGMFFLLLRLQVPGWGAFTGAVGMGFFAYYIHVVEAGHLAKIQTLMPIPGLVLGIIQALTGRWLRGAVLTAFFGALFIGGAHYQMQYYFLFFGLGLGIAYLVLALQQHSLRAYLVGVVALLFAIGLGLLLRWGSIAEIRQYGAYSIRSQSELQPETEARLKGQSPSNQSEGTKTALDKDYAYSWSHGRTELLSLLIPNAVGGGSSGGLRKGGELYKRVQGTDQNQNGISDSEEKIWPLYWGPQGFTAGPYYLGAIFIFLFILGLILVHSPLKWGILYPMLLLGILSLGRYSLSIPQSLVVLSVPLVFQLLKPRFSRWPAPALGLGLCLLALLILNLMPQGGYPDGAYTLADWFMDNMPLYDRFRTPASILAVIAIFVPLLGMLGLRELLNKERDLKLRKQALFYAAGIPLAICLLFALMPGMLADRFLSAEELLQLNEQSREYYDLLETERKAQLSADAWRSFGFIALAALLLWGMLAGSRSSRNLALAGVALLVVLDVFVLDMRYLWRENYVPRQETEAPVRPLDIQMQTWLQDQYFRVLPITRGDPFNSDGLTPRSLYSIGGYSPIKMKRYQQLIEAYLAPSYRALAQGQVAQAHWNVLNMLNTRYIIHQPGLPDSLLQPALPQPVGGEIPYRNPAAYGPAWITPQVRILPRPDDVLLALDSVNSAQLALLEATDQPKLGSYSQEPLDSTETIQLTQWENNRMAYDYRSSKARFVTFSEVYYPPAWTAYLDKPGGQELPIQRVNFVQRGLVVPAGTHKIFFVARNEVVKSGAVLSTIGSILFLLLLGAYAWVELRKRKAA